MSQDYVYIDHDGSLLDQNDQPDQDAALQHARVLAAEYQARFVCVAEVIRYRLEVPVCDCCGFRFDGEGALCPGCSGETMPEQGKLIDTTCPRSPFVDKIMTENDLDREAAAQLFKERD